MQPHATYGCSPYRKRLQPLPRTAAASAAYGCSICHVRLQARYPFLDEDVVATLAALPLPLLCDLRLEAGRGDKIVLRRSRSRLQ